MLKTLLQKQLTEIFRSYFYDAKKGRARSKAGTAAYLIMFAVLMVGVLGGMFTLLSVMLCAALAQAGLSWMYFALMTLLAVFLGAFGSVFNTYSGLYLAKDNDLLLSMPIPVGKIMLARLLGVYLMGLMYSGVVIVPAVIVYWVCVPVTAGAVIGGVLLILLVSVFVLTLSCALGWVVARISVKLKNRSFITVLLAVLFFGLYYFVYFKAQSVIADLLQNAAIYGEKISASAYPVVVIGRVGTGDLAAALIVTAVVAALFALMWALIARSFLKIATDPGKTARRVYREKAARVRRPGTALLHRELARFVSSPNYMLNCGFGLLFLLVGGVALLWRGDLVAEVLRELFSDDPGAVDVMACTAICFLASTNDMAAPSVSLEGKSLWIVQTLPVEPRAVLRAKAGLQLVLTMPPLLFCAVCAALTCAATAAGGVCLVLSVLAYGLCTTLLSLLLGTKLASFGWTSELTPIKQSGAVAFSLLSAIVLAVLPIAGYLLFGHLIGAAAFLLLVTAVLLTLSGAAWLWLKKRGAAVIAGQ